VKRCPMKRWTEWSVPGALLVPLILLGQALLPMPAPGAELVNRVVAIVNDDVVTLHELNRKMKLITGVDPEVLKARSEEEYFKTRQEILERLIDEKIARKRIQELEITVFPEEVDAAIERIKQDNHVTQEELEAGLQERGLTLEDYKNLIKEELERIRLINEEIRSKIIIREKDIRDYYLSHEEEFASQDKVRLAAIVLRPRDPLDKEEVETLMQKGRALVAQLHRGEDFSRMARAHSQGPAAQEGGDLGTFLVERLDPQLREVIEELQAGEVSEPIWRGSTVQILKVLARQKGGIKPYTQVKEAIRQILYRQEIQRRYASWLKDQRSKSYTKVIF